MVDYNAKKEEALATFGVSAVGGRGEEMSEKEIQPSLLYIIG